MDKTKTRIEPRLDQNLNSNGTCPLSKHAIVQFETQSKSRKQSKEYRKLQTQTASTGAGKYSDADASTRAVKHSKTDADIDTNATQART